MATTHDSERLQRAEFPSTHWSQILVAGDATTTQSAEALEALCRQYWLPLYGFARRQGMDYHAAHDATQEFFVHFLELGALRIADRSRGRFRSFLMTCFTNFLRDQYRRAEAGKRRPEQRLLSLDAEEAEKRFASCASQELTPEQLYERQWALALWEQVFVRLRQEHTGTPGLEERFDALLPFLQGEAGETGYDETALRLRMTGNAVKVAVHRLRQRFGQLLREEVGRTVASAAEIDDEIRQLFRALST